MAKRVNIRDFTTDYEALWYNPECHRYSSRVFSVSDLRDYKGNVRFVMVKNRAHKSGDNRPSFLFSIRGTNAEPTASLTMHKQHDPEMYMSVSDALEIARRGADMIRSGYDEYDAYAPQDFYDAPSAALFDPDMALDGDE